MRGRHISWRLWAVRALALSMALLCLGISGGTALLHTEEDGIRQSYPVGRSVLTHLAFAADTPCLACQWEAAACDPALPPVPIVPHSLVWIPFSAAKLQTVIPSPFALSSPRAPPCAA